MFTKWRDADFVAKYRLCKPRVKRLARQFAAYSRTAGTKVGGGISHFQQVGANLIQTVTLALANHITQLEVIPINKGA